ncbi:AAA family ATPase [Nocardioides caricicola]|uniref:AAA family ATPase n=1 Tax=Nocardioides caricicola TaxID=634770 RepID=A0ABW0MUJ9_9ACTN
MSRLIHLNGPPGIGKSTIARRYAAEHPGVLNCDIDVLRTLIGGWDADFELAGTRIRPAALAMIEAYLASGQDVVLPQMLINPVERARFEDCAARAGAEYVERFLMDSQASSVARFHRRGGPEEDPWHDLVRTIVAADGGDDSLRTYYAGLDRLIGDRPDAVVIASSEGAVDETYEAFVASLGRPT